MIRSLQRISPFFKILYLVAVVSLTTLTILFGGSTVSLILTLCGLTAATLNTRRLKLCYPFYFVQALLYSLVSLHQRYYGEAIINLLYATPMYLHAIFFWKKRTEQQVVTDIYTLPLKAFGILAAAGVAAIPSYGYVLSLLGTHLPYLNAASTYIYIVAIYLVTKRYIEQWLLWSVHTLISLVLWLSTFSNDLSQIPIVGGTLFYFTLNVVGYLSWRKLKKYLDEEAETL